MSESPLTRRRSVIVLACLISVIAACRPAPNSTVSNQSQDADSSVHVLRRNTQNVVILLLDCVRADHIGAYGYPRPTTPNLDALATDAVLFEQAISQSNWTKPSIVSLFTGTYLSQHLITDGRLGGRIEDDGTVPTGHVMVEEFTTLAEYMSRGGFAAGGFVNQGHLPAHLGFAQGFDVYESGLHDPEVEQFFEAWVNQLGDRRFFAYLHLLDLHFPYTTQDHLDIFNDDLSERPMTRLMQSGAGGEEIRRRASTGGLSQENVHELIGLYDGELLGVDDRLGSVVRYLKASGLYDSTLIIVTADHGEAFLEHNYFEHGENLLYSELIRVPLIIKFPNRQHAGQRISAPAQLIDILPTLQEHFGLAASQEVGGTSLIGLIEGTASPHTVLSELSDLDGRKALYHGGRKFIFQASGQAEVFDYTTDPLDLVNLADGVAAHILEEAKTILQELLTRNEEFAKEMAVAKRPLNQREIQRLRSLGYIR